MPENRRGKLRLDMNESPVGCSPRVRAVLRRLDAQALSMYPEKGNAAQRMAPFFGLRADEMVLAGGIDDALRLLSDVFLERGRIALIVEPTFPMYRFYAGQREARICALRYDREMQFPLGDVLRVLRAVSGAPSVFFLANPNNPTGSLLPKKALAQILDAAAHTLVVVDEAYFEFSGVTVLPWIRRRRNLVVTRTFSKAAGLAGLRIGCIFAHREVARVLRFAQAPFPIGIAPLAAAETALRDRTFTRRAAAQILRGRKILEDGLCALGIRCFPSAASFVLADFGARGAEVTHRLARRGILIRDLSASLGRAGWARITAGTPAQMRRLLAELEKILGGNFSPRANRA